MSIQQTYTSTLSSHVTTIYSKIAEQQQHIQQRWMYSHNIEAQQIDVVQIEVLEYDPDIDGDKESHTDNRCATVPVQNILDDNHNIPDLIDDNSTTLTLLQLIKITLKPIGLMLPPPDTTGIFNYNRLATQSDIL